MYSWRTLFEHSLVGEPGLRSLDVGYYCRQCGLHCWNVPNNAGLDFYCQACVIHFEEDRWRGLLAQVASDPFGSFPCGFADAVVACLAGDLDLVPRHRRRDALHVFLESPGLLRQFRGQLDLSDHGLMEYRRNLLEKIITFLI